MQESYLKKKGDSHYSKNEGFFLIKKNARHDVNIHSNMKITILMQSEQCNTVKSGHFSKFSA